ncbi:MAG TPA: DUF4301 family protein [Candidatus Binatia bacterium]|nr:DUF4301 family protein [Candidatus Binatia bacterium]
MTKNNFFRAEDLRQIEEHGLTLEKVLSDIERFERGFPVVKLQRPCTVGDGITVLQDGELARLGHVHAQAVAAGRMAKFVPASGAASRMFQLLLSFLERSKTANGSQNGTPVDTGDHDYQMVLQFMRGLKQFAFYDELRLVMARDGLHIEQVLTNGRHADILTYLLTATGLDYANLPKGLIPFHRYADHTRTPLEEHLLEAAAYAQDQDRTARVHFTVPVEYQEAMCEHVEAVRQRCERGGCRYVATFSVQKPSTDTIAVDQQNQPFRDEVGQLVFRPAGHGALLENLDDLQGDIIFIKNIDNLAVDRLKPQTYRYKKALAGYLVELQNAIFGYLQALLHERVEEQSLQEIFAFAREKLFIVPPVDLARQSRAERIAFLAGRLNRPLRVCGVVPNTGEPGGGPFWVQQSDNTLSLQIIEAAQVDMQDAGQRVLWEAATHFNPVDLVCGVRDYRDRPFNLLRFSDPDTGFIAQKSKDGKVLQALELPGLWNGAMAHWNTVFIEVPLITFNPVKTVFDLLRDAHQGA